MNFKTYLYQLTKVNRNINHILILSKNLVINMFFFLKIFILIVYINMKRNEKKWD